MTVTATRRRPYVIYLIGYPAVGKYTIATEIAAMTGAVVIDNQLVNHPVLALFDWDGVSILPVEIWGPIATIRDAVLSVVEDLAPRSISYVLTNALQDDADGDALFQRIRRLAAAREAVFVPTVLTCDVAEQSRRVAGVDRRRRLKLSDPDQLRDYMASTAMYTPVDPGLFALDTTHLSPAQAATAILDHADRLGQTLTPESAHEARG